MTFAIEVLKLGRVRNDEREQYLRFAQECVEPCAAAKTPGDKARFLEMAQAWRDLAERIREDRTKED